MLIRFAATLLVILTLLESPRIPCAQAGWSRPEASSPDGTISAALQKDCTVVLRYIASGDTIATLYEPSDGCGGTIREMYLHQRSPSRWVIFSPDGRLLATDRGHGPLNLWRVRDRSKVASLEAGYINSLEFLLDSTVILVLAAGPKGFHSDTVAVWDVATQRRLFQARETSGTQFKKATLSPDGKMILALIGPSGEKVARHVTDRIKLWDIESGKELANLGGLFAQFSPDDESLLVTDSGRRMLWDIRAGKMISTEQSSSPRAQAITADSVSESIGNNVWKWIVFIKGNRQSLDDIKCVEYTVPPTFLPNPVRLVCEPGDPQRPFGLSAACRSAFSIGIRVFMKDGTHQDLRHQLKF